MYVIAGNIRLEEKPSVYLNKFVDMKSVLRANKGAVEAGHKDNTLIYDKETDLSPSLKNNFNHRLITSETVAKRLCIDDKIPFRRKLNWEPFTLHNSVFAPVIYQEFQFPYNWQYYLNAEILQNEKLKDYQVTFGEVSIWKQQSNGPLYLKGVKRESVGNFIFQPFHNIHVDEPRLGFVYNGKLEDHNVSFGNWRKEVWDYYSPKTSKLIIDKI